MSKNPDQFNEAVRFIQSKEPMLWGKTENILSKAMTQFHLELGPDDKTDTFKHIGLSVNNSRDYIQSKMESFLTIVVTCSRIRHFMNILQDHIGMRNPTFHQELKYWRSLR